MDHFQIIPGAAPGTASSPTHRDVFKFFDLSRELRDAIYDLLAEDTKYVDPRSRATKIRARAAIESLQLVSHRFSDEYAERAEKFTEMRLTIMLRDTPQPPTSLPPRTEAAGTLHVMLDMLAYDDDSDGEFRRMFTQGAQWALGVAERLPLLKETQVVFWFHDERSFRSFTRSDQNGLVDLQCLGETSFACHRWVTKESIKNENYHNVNTITE